MTEAAQAAAYRIRRVREGDVAAVLDAFRSADDMMRQGDVSDEVSARRYVSWLQRPERRGYAVTCDDVVVGMVGASLDAAHRSAWVFFWMHARHRGCGVMARAVATVADGLLCAADEGGEGLERLELGHRVDNPGSGRVARAAGFVVEGREREKFLVDGTRVDVLTYGRLGGDRWPTIEHLPLGEPRSGAGAVSG